jgi:cysteinyl-tRNA synthetase
VDACYDAMNDDFNSPIVIANLFEAVRIVNTVKDGKAQINAEELALLNKLFQDFVFDILGLVESNASEGNGALVEGLMQTIIGIRKQARDNKDWATSDLIRDELAKYDIVLKDGKEGTTWSLK